MFPNAKGSDLFAVLATVDPASLSVGTVSTGWVSPANFHALLASIETGLLGASATLDAKFQQATDASGTGAKDISGKAIAQIVKASGDNKHALINLKPDDLDSANGYAYVRLSITVGVAASVAGAQLLGVNPRYASAEAFNQAALVQII